jgi:hypothetical protein
MKLLLSILFLTISLVVTTPTHSQSHPPVYLTLVSHNEDNIQWLTRSYYIQRRNLLVQIANVVQSRNAVWDFQSDWRFLLAVQQFDTGTVLANTNGKNLLRWFVEDKGVTCDPHSHENGYNYADVAYLHEQLGIMATKVVGGFLYDTVINGNNWENLENGIYGRIYPSYFWRPDILWGGGTPNHVNDPYPLGAWKPQSMPNYYVHDSTKHLVLLGHGCENHITDTSNIANNVNITRNIVDLITIGSLPDTGFYPAFSIFNNGDLTTTQITKITEFIDSVAGMVAQGRVVWKSLPDIYTIWNTTYNRKPYRVMCEDIPTAVRQIDVAAPQQFLLYQNYPNPFNPSTMINYQLAMNSYVTLKVFDVLGREVATLVDEVQDAAYQSVKVDARLPGVYRKECQEKIHPCNKR